MKPERFFSAIPFPQEQCNSDDLVAPRYLKLHEKVKLPVVLYPLVFVGVGHFQLLKVHKLLRPLILIL